MILYIKNTKDWQKMFELINEKSFRIKKSVCKASCIFYTITIKNQKEKLKWNNPIVIAMAIIKCLRINENNEMKFCIPKTIKH